MASTYTINTGIELITNGEQSGTWGDTTNTNLEIVDRLTSGVGGITLSGTTHTLSTSDGALSEGQYKVLVFWRLSQWDEHSYCFSERSEQAVLHRQQLWRERYHQPRFWFNSNHC